MLESAIPNHLQKARTLPAKVREEFQPAYPSFAVRFPEHAKDLVMAIFGMQYLPADDYDASSLSKISSFLGSPDESMGTYPSFWETASVTDNVGFYNVVILAYWPSKDTYDTWAVASGFEGWWNALDPNQESHGWFREIFFPAIERLETVFTSQTTPEGAGRLLESMSGPVKEHGYWGAVRDRLPIAQTDVLTGEKVVINEGIARTDDKASSKRRVRVAGKRNLTIIRSGQDWSQTSPEERKLYLETMHPVLEEGMHFLRDHGTEVGCLGCRLMEVIDPETLTATEKSFGLAYFDDLSSLERWSKEHPTHLKIFRGFFHYAKQLDNNITLRLYHEVLVLEPEQQLFEYIGCHGRTGMLVCQ